MLILKGYKFAPANLIIFVGSLNFCLLRIYKKIFNKRTFYDVLSVFY